MIINIFLFAYFLTSKNQLKIYFYIFSLYNAMAIWRGWFLLWNDQLKLIYNCQMMICRAFLPIVSSLSSSYRAGPRISLILPLHSSLSSMTFSRSSRLYPVFVQNWCRKVLAGLPTPVRLCKGVYRRTSLMSSPLLLQLCPAYLVRLIWMVLEMGGRWLYSRCFVGCCFQDLFNMARSILVQLLSNIFAVPLVSVNVVHPYSIMDTTAAWKKLRFILSD